MLYMLLDTSVTAKVLKVAPLREIQLHARLVAADNPRLKLIAPPVDGRSFAALPVSHLMHLIADLGLSPREGYEGWVEQALEAVQALTPDTTPLAALEREVTRRGVPEPNLNHPTPKPAAEPKPKKERSTEFKDPTRPKDGTTTGLVWDMADALCLKLGRIPSGKEMIADCDREGIKAGTVSVQFGKWRTWKLSQEQ
jgi:hypothetical protein